jgi:hypothetical protein
MLEKIQKNWFIHTFLVEIQNGTANLKIVWQLLMKRNMQFNK